ncbi:MAG: hypothetical protein PHG83_00725 [Patescibacteria group bacterium]|nr:hypothetical protein [Patescibacteria group bacterium]
MELNNKKVEVELRGMLSKEKFDILSDTLGKQYPYKDDNKETLFYVTIGFILKIEKRNNSEEIFLIVKNGDETKNILEEIEIRLNSSDLYKIIKIFDNLGFSKINIVKQKRKNYYLEDGIVFSLKYTDDWGYHFEIEKVVEINNAESAKKLLTDKCRSLDIKFMNDIEIAKKITDINKKHGYI